MNARSRFERPGLWVPLFADLRRHPKLTALAVFLGVKDPDLVRAKLENLWTFAIEHAKDGRLTMKGTTIDIPFLSHICGWEGDPNAFVTGLIKFGWLEGSIDSGLSIFNWFDYSGVLHKSREQDAKKHRDARASKKLQFEGKSQKDTNRHTHRENHDVPMTSPGRPHDEPGTSAQKKEPALIEQAYALAESQVGSSEALKRYIGFLEAKPEVESSRILENVRKLFNYRQGMNLQMGDKVPFDRIFSYGIDQAIEHDALGVSYVTKVCQTEFMRQRDGCGKS